jgi:hypothetical protein
MAFSEVMAGRIRQRLARRKNVEVKKMFGGVGFLLEELDLVALARRQMARTLRLVAPDAWQRPAVHSETGLVTLRQLLLHAINHLRHHLRLLAEKRAAMTTP